VQPDAVRLADIPLFSSLGEESLGRLAAWSESRSARPGERIVGEGTSGYSFFVIEDGSAVVTQDERELTRLGPGDFFGELALFGDGRRTATVTALEPTKLVVMFGTEFRQLERELPDVAAEIQRAVTARLG
jgi:CRP-like cAMP-binding protein